MPTTPFGNAGSRIERTYQPSVAINFNDGEFLRFRLTVSGAEAVFAFECKHDQERLSQSSFEDHPTDVYTWDLGLGLDQEPDTNKKDTYALGMLFTAVAPGKYTLEVDHLDADGGVKEHVIDVDYTSTDPADKFTEILAVFPV